MKVIYLFLCEKLLYVPVYRMCELSLYGTWGATEGGEYV